jgi:hypothetical protein
VCFQYIQPDQHLELPGFAEEFFEKFEIDAFFVNCATNEWYQYPDLPRALSILQGFAGVELLLTDRALAARLQFVSPRRYAPLAALRSAPIFA